jgi:hypothetical protein
MRADAPGKGGGAMTTTDELGLTSIRIRTVDAVLADSARKANPVRPGVLAYLEAS